MLSGTVYQSKSARIAFLLCLFFGIFGLHRFYVGKIVTGLLMIITLGGLGVWIMIDLGNIVCNRFQDSKQNTLEFTRNPSLLKKLLMTISSATAGLIIFFVIFSMIIHPFTNGATETIRDQLNALNSGNIEQAYSYTSKEFQEETPLNQFKQFVKEYPILSQFRNASNTSVKIVKNRAIATFVLRTENSDTPVDYKLVKEHDKWKIYSLYVGETVPADNALFTFSSSITFNNLDTDKNMAPEHPSNEAVSLIHTYESTNNRYSMKYPADWEHSVIGKGSIEFNAVKGSPLYGVAINIQTVLTKKSGGIYSTIGELLAEQKKMIAEQLPDAKFINQGEIELAQDPKEYQGMYLIFTYKSGNEDFKQMLFIILGKDGSLFHLWAYAAPVVKFDAGLPTAKAMYESWSLY